MSAIIAMQGGGIGMRQCDLLANELLDLDIAAVELGLSRENLQNRLDIDGFPLDGLQTDCRVTYSGRDESDTLNVLNALAKMFVKNSVRMASEERARIDEFAQDYLAEIAERRTIADSPDGETTVNEQKWIITGDVENWSIGRVESVIARLNTILNTEHEKPTEASCVEYLDRLDDYPSEALHTLDTRCRESKPIGIEEWPKLAERCESSSGGA